MTNTPIRDEERHGVDHLEDGRIAVDQEQVAGAVRAVGHRRGIPEQLAHGAAEDHVRRVGEHDEAPFEAGRRAGRSGKATNRCTTSGNDKLGTSRGERERQRRVPVDRLGRRRGSRGPSSAGRPGSPGRRCHAISPATIQIPPMHDLADILGRPSGRLEVVREHAPGRAPRRWPPPRPRPARRAGDGSSRPGRRARRAPHPTGRPCG